MKRREFLQVSTLTTLGLLFAPRFNAYAADFKVDTSFDGRVVIIGAGVAGLFAGYILKANGIDFTILEASGRMGGRIKGNDTFADFSLDLGAEWMHGATSVLGDWVRTHGINKFEDESSAQYWYRGERTATIPSSLDYIVSEEVFEDEDAGDESLLGFSLGELEVDPRDVEFIEYAAGERGSSAKNVSVKRTRQEEQAWSSGSKDFKFNESFFSAIRDTLIEEMRDHVHLNTIVSEIDYSGEVTSIACANGVNYHAHNVMITVPITMLKKRTITFTPNLPQAKFDAFDRIGMEPGMKVFLKFSTRFFGESLIGGALCPSYLDPGYGKSGSDIIFAGFVMGDKAKYLSDLGDDAIPEILKELDVIYNNQATASFVDGFLQDWGKEPHIEGAYSYSAVGIKVADRAEAAKPIGEKLFFAGEAMNTAGHFQTVHGAMETGQRDAMLILNQGSPSTPIPVTGASLVPPATPLSYNAKFNSYEHTVSVVVGSGSLLSFQRNYSGICPPC